MFIKKPHLAIHEVQKESLSLNSVVTGVIIRDEIVETTNKAGRVNYYLRDGARVKKNAAIYSVDDSNIFSSVYQNASFELTEADALQVKNRIKSYQKKYSDNNYAIVEDFKQDITSQIQQIIDTNLAEQITAYMNETGNSYALNTVHSDKTGVITYYVDNLDGIEKKEVTSSTFDRTDFTKENVRNTELHEIDSKAYKLITSEEWKIIAPVERDLYDILVERKSVKIRFLEDNFVVTVPSEVYTIGTDYFVELSFSDHMIRYRNLRFVDIEFLIHSDIGLKIPLTAIVDKEFFMVPLSCFTLGGNERNEDGLIVRTYSEASGEYEFNFKKTEKYYDDGEYAYVDMNEFTYNTFIVYPDSPDSDPFRIGLIDKLEGVYNINKGFAIFRRIERISENEEYCIIKEGTPNGVALFDHIALDYTTAIEEKSIY